MSTPDSTDDIATELITFLKIGLKGVGIAIGFVFFSFIVSDIIDADEHDRFTLNGIEYDEPRKSHPGEERRDYINLKKEYFDLNNFSFYERNKEHIPSIIVTLGFFLCMGYWIINFIKQDELENQNDLANRQDQDTKKGNMGWYLQVLKKYAVFKGRARRKEYWVFMLINTTVIAILMIIEAVTGIQDIYSISDLYGLAVAIPVSAVATRRLHDTGRSGWWQFLILVLVIGWIPLLIWLLKDSDDGDNKYGPNPKEIPTLADTNIDINA